MSLRPVLGPRWDRCTPGHCGVSARPPLVSTTVAPASKDFGARSHGIGTRCLRFAVEVSLPHARLASGCWPSSAGRDSLTRRVAMKGFRVRVSFSFLELAWRYDTELSPWHEWHSVKLNTLGFKVLRRKTPAHRLVINNMISISLDPKPSVSEAYSIFYILTAVDICWRRVDRNSLIHKMLLLIRVPFVSGTEKRLSWRSRQKSRVIVWDG